MKDFVWTRSICAVASATSISILWMMFIAAPVAGLVSVGLLGLLTVAVALWVGTRATPSITQVIAGIEAELVPAAETPLCAGRPMPKSIL
jgi:galactitol-specific phosphotransferase system IIC component